jgi:hypothetical protein
MFIETLAIHLLVVCFLNVVISMDLRHVHVCQHTLDLLQTVVLNVLSILSAQATKLVYKRNVEIHV